MKAIKVLENIKLGAFGSYIENKNKSFYDEAIEAIAELEALENINCDGCKYYLSDNGNYPLEPCGECSRFYSDRYESKQ